MASTTIANQQGTIRVNIGKKDLVSWVGQDVPQSIVTHWIKLGRQRESLAQRVYEENGMIRDEIAELREELRELAEEQRELVIRLSQVLGEPKH